MSPRKNEINIKEEGFITTKKGLTLSTISLFIWVLTGIFYKIASFIFIPDYQAFCFFVSLSLSILSGLYVTNNLVNTKNQSTKMLLLVANILLLYTSANGIQTGYCFLSSPSENQEVTEMSLLPFLDSRPWLPDKFQSNKIDELEVQKKTLELKVDQLQRFTADKSELIKELENLKAANQFLRDNVKSMQSRLDATSDYNQIKAELKVSQTDNQELDAKVSTLQSELNERSDYALIKGELENMKRKYLEVSDDNKELSSKLNEAVTRMKEFETQNRSLRSELNNSNARIERLVERIRKNNTLQETWRNKLAENDRLIKMRGMIIEFFGQDYYANFFEIPISLD